MDINLIENMNVKKVSVMKVTAALKENGYLLDEPNPETGKTRSDAVTNVKPGDRVTVNVETFCGECFFCKKAM